VRQKEREELIRAVRLAQSGTAFHYRVTSRAVVSPQRVAVSEFMVERGYNT
jgi:hypothetical protein